MRILGIEFAPLNVPLERRLQTLSVLFLYSNFMFLGMIGPLILIALLFTPYYFLTLVYMTWFVYDLNVENRGGRPLKWLRDSALWRHFANYFPIKMVKVANLDPKRNYFFCFHPHGILPAGCGPNFASDTTGFAEMFPGIKPRLLSLAGIFMIPIHRDYALSLGFCSVSKDSIDWLMTKEGQGNAAVIVIGGAAEALDARPGEATLTINRRKGFIRLAMKYGAPLVPIYSFGENDQYNQLHNPVGSLLRKFQDKLTKLCGFSLPLFAGRGVFNYTLGHLPHRNPITTVVGRPIDVEKCENPSQEAVNELHSEYLKQLKKLYDDHKGKYGNPEKELVFI